MNANEQEPPRSFFGRVKRCGAWILRTAWRDQVMSAVVLGFVVGFLLNFTVTLSRLNQFAIRFPGELLMHCLHVLTTPLIITGVTEGVGRVKSGFSERSLSYRSTYITFTTFLSVVLALSLALVIKPGVDSHKKEAKKDAHILKFLDAFVDLTQTVIPLDPIQGVFQKHKTVWLEVEADEQNSPLLHSNDVRIERFYIHGTNIVGLVVWSIMAGLYLERMGGHMDRHVENFLEFLASINQIIHIVAHWILCLLPLAIGSMVPGIVVQADDWTMASKLGQFIAVVVLGLIIHGLVVLPGIYFLVVRRNPYVLIKEMLPRLKTALLTPSRNGTVIYEVVAAIFIAQIHHINWDVGTLFVLALASAVPGAAGPGIPAGGAVAVFFVLTVVNLPVNAACLLVPIQYLLNRLNSVVDVMGDCIGEALRNADLEDEQGLLI